MQVILLEQIHNLGSMGETVTVKPGFARNFLIPEEKALPATKANVARFEAMKAELAKQDAEKKKNAETIAAKFDGLTVTLARQASEVGQLYGSIKPSDITKELEEKGFELPRGAVDLGKPIKTVGEFTAQVKLHPEVEVALPVIVERQSS